MKKAFGALLFAVALPASASTSVVYNVSDSSVNNCSPHGLWTNQDFGGSRCANYFSIEGTLVMEGDNSQAVLVATAVNPDNRVANISLTFSDFAETHTYKQEGGIAWSPATDGANDIDFFTSVVGTIEVDGEVYTIDSFVDPYAAQFGIGANAKDPEAMGASAWIQGTMNSHHWDLNLNLQSVPEPAAFALLGLGIAGLGLRRRRQIAAAQ